MCLFKRKKCLFHDWKLSDYRTYVEAHSSTCTQEYTLICTECHKKKKVEQYDYDKLKQLNLLK